MYSSHINVPQFHRPPIFFNMDNLLTECVRHPGMPKSSLPLLFLLFLECQDSQEGSGGNNMDLHNFG